MMDKDFAFALANLTLGAFAGWAYFSALIVFWGTFLIQLKESPKNEWGMVIFVNAFFRPPLALAIVGLYAIYSLLVGDLPLWFVIGSFWPVVTLAIESYKDRNRSVHKN